MNAFPSTQGGLGDYSPQYIMTGWPITYKAHMWCEFGQYTQTHEEHDNSMDEQTTGVICLGPTGNQSGGHYFMSLSTRSVIRHSRWTELPIVGSVRLSFIVATSFSESRKRMAGEELSLFTANLNVKVVPERFVHSVRLTKKLIVVSTICVL